jgi:6-phosphofructokinase 1
MAELIGNLLVAQSGGPTSVINASIAGVITEAGHHECIEEIFGGQNGILGILNEDLIDINDERSKSIEGLRNTPAAALGTCRYKIDFKKKPEKAAKDMDRLFEVFAAHNIRYFFYAGGNDSQDTAHKIHLEAVKRGYDMRVMGVPKTIDNDLPATDHCPGYGSVIKYNSATVMEIGFDVGSMATDDGSCCIVEVMGRAAGWIAAGTVLAKQGNPANPPHIIVLPEIPLNETAFLNRVKEVVAEHKYCVVVCGEGVKNEAGEEIGADKTRLDAFGHAVLSGAADALASIVQGKLNLKTRTVKLGYAQRAAAGLMLTEAIYVSPMAKGYVRTPGLWNDAQQAVWARIVKAVHAAGGRIFAQLFHTGRVALPDFLPGGAQPVAPSAIAIKGQNKTDDGKKDYVVPRALETDEIPGVAAEFASAAKRAMAAARSRLA